MLIAVLRALILTSVTGLSIAASSVMAADNDLQTVRLAPKGERAAPPPPKRPYAINGESFYYAGQKIIIEGLDLPRPDSEVAKQRLQKILDSGDLSLAPVGEPEGDTVRARVSIDGEAISH